MRIWALCLLGLLLCPVGGWAQDNTTEAGGASLKAEAQADREALKSARQEIKENSQEGRQEEDQLRQQLQEAERSGDQGAAQQLRKQLRAMHQENVAQMRQDKGALKEARQERREGMPPRGEFLPRLTPPVQGEGAESGERMGPPRPTVPPPPVLEAMRERRERAADRLEDVRDRREDVADRAEDIRDRREDAWDATHNAPVGTEAWKRDRMEDARDRREDVADRKEDRMDKREDRRDIREDRLDRGRGAQGQAENAAVGRGPREGRGPRLEGQGTGVGRGPREGRGPVGGVKKPSKK